MEKSYKRIKVDVAFDGKFKTEKELAESLPIKKCFSISHSELREHETLIVFNAEYEVPLVIIACSDITGCKKIIESDKFTFVIYINNKSEKWWRRFGFSIHF